MRQNNASPCAKILRQARQPVLERARSLQRLERAVLGVLPQDMAAHCSVMNLKKETLVLGVRSPAWASRLRFAAPRLLKQLQCQLSLEVRRLDVRVIPEREEIPLPSRRPVGMSLDNATLLARTADSVDHPQLREALYRLAAKTRGS